MNTKTMYIASLDDHKIISSVKTIEVSKDTEDFIFYHDGIRLSKLKKVADTHCIFDSYDQAKSYLIARIADLSDSFSLLMDLCEVEVEKLKRSKDVADVINIKFEKQEPVVYNRDSVCDEFNLFQL